MRFSGAPPFSVSGRASPPVNGPVTATLVEGGSIAAFDACLYQMDQESQQFSRTTQEAEFRLAWLDDSGAEPR